MLRNQNFPLDKIYVPTARRKSLDPEKVKAIAEDWLANGQKTPIQVREDGERYVLVEGLHRLEAARVLGEKTIIGLLVQARRH
jgi:ParB-like chromosome segregation protein Spo0J